jgi:hypothetical protein
MPEQNGSGALDRSAHKTSARSMIDAGVSHSKSTEIGLEIEQPVVWNFSWERVTHPGIPT